MQKLFIVIISMLMVACGVEQPDGIPAVKNFKIKRYMGRWYEIARLDHPFERGLNSVTADLSMDYDGKITMRHQGYMVKQQDWRESVGTAYLAGGPKEGFLKVSYVPFFYGPYVIFGLEEDYEYAFVAGRDKSQLWLMAREAVVDWGVVDKFIEASKKLGFDDSKLIYVEHLGY